jgi:cobalt-zinc-cadmium efflux system membrane fusion protein
MTRHWLIRFALLGACVAVLTSCGKKDADDTAAKPEPKPNAAQKGVVELTEESLKNAHVETVTVTRTNTTVALSVPGRIGYDLNLTAKVSSPFAGRIRKMNHDVGATVKQGEIMALIDSPELLNPLELRAPLDGTVTERQGAVGGMLEAAKEFYTISDLSRVWCIASISEGDGAGVHVGQTVAIRVLAYPNETFAGTVALPGQAVDETTRTLEARIEVDNRDGKLKPGMFATVSLPTDRIESQLLVPDDAVQTVFGQTCVFVEEQPGKFRLAIVRLGRQMDGRDAVLEGLDEGARVVVSGSFVLKSELLKASMEEP